MRKIILITGTSKGLGHDLAKKYLEEGYIVIGCSRNEADINHTDYSHYRVDIANESDVINMVRDVKRRFGIVDVLLNNAGIASMNHIVTTTANKAREVFETNFMGTFLFTREIAKQMLRKKSGVIVNYSTVAVPLNLEGEAIYAASKAAVESFTKISAKEFGEFGIRVNAVGPAPVSTDLTRQVPEEKMQALLDKQIFHRMGTVDDVKNVVDFFISDKSSYVTGQIVYLGGIMQ